MYQKADKAHLYATAQQGEPVNDSAEEQDMDTKSNRDRLIEACDTDANAAAAIRRARMERASRPARRIVQMTPVD